MKINKWTVGLAAAGVVSLGSVAQAEETSVPLLTALSATTISGYVDTSAHWNIGRQGVAGARGFQPAYGLSGHGAKNDGFNVNSVVVSVEKPLDEALWSAGYRIDLQWGEDQIDLTGGGPVRQAFVDMRAPVGTGLDFRIGRFDGLLGFESPDSYKNPNYTRSYGFMLQPTTHTGALLSYHLLDWVSISGGVANTLNPTPVGLSPLGVVDRSPRSESHKTYMGSIAITMPDEFGFFAGSGLFAGFANGFGNAGPGVANKDQSNLYVGGTIGTPIEGLRLGVSYDYIWNLAGQGLPLNHPTAGPINLGSNWTVAGYGSFQATDALGLHLRGEYVKGNPLLLGDNKLFALTGTIDYALWQNVLTRAEVRWDRAIDGARPFRGTPGMRDGVKDEVLIAGNVVYKF